jgi:hypothetical protein
MSTKKEDRYLKEPLGQKTIHGERALSEDGSYNAKFVDVGGGYRKKQGFLRSPSPAN